MPEWQTRLPSPADRWMVTRDGVGAFRLRDMLGSHPLEHEDPLVRASAYYLAAGAPELFQQLEVLTKRFDYLYREGRIVKDRRDEQRIRDSECALSGARVPMNVWKDVFEATRGGQREISFESLRLGHHPPQRVA